MLLNFWATWCPPCRFEMPFIQEIFEDKGWSGKGLKILAVDVGEDLSTVKEFLDDKGFSFPVLLDTKQDVAAEYDIRYFPTTFFVDKDGVIQAVEIGAFPSKADLEGKLRNLIP